MADDSFDFLSPFISAVIVTEEGRRYPLWTNPVVSPDEEDWPNALAFVSSVTIEMQLAFAPIITVELTPTIEDARKLIGSSLIEWGMSRLEVQYGYTTGAPSGAVLSPIMQGILLEPEVSLGSDATITLKAQGVGAYAMQRSKSGRTWNNATREEILEELVSGPRSVLKTLAAADENDTLASLYAKFAPNISSTMKRDVRLDLSEVRRDKPSSTKNLTGVTSVLAGKSANLKLPSTLAYDLMFVDRLSASQSFLSDWMMLWQIVRQARCTMTVVSDPKKDGGMMIKVIPTSLFRLSPPKRILRFYDYPLGQFGPGLDPGVLPILEVSSGTQAVYAPSALRKMKQVDLESESREDAQMVHSDESAQTERTAEGAVAPPITSESPGTTAAGDGGGHAPGSPANDQALAQARAEYDAMTNAMGINMEITTLMDPYLVPGETVQVEGVSKKHDANMYGILKTVVTVGTGGADMQLTLVSNTAQLGSRLDAQMPTGPTNKSRLTAALGGFLDGASGGGTAGIDSGPAVDPQ